MTPSPPEPTREDVENVFLDLIAGAITREQASDWALQWSEADDIEIEESIWLALTGLMGADLPSTDRRYLHDESDFRDWLDKFRERYRANGGKHV